jgi:hypothetical protein
VTWIVDFDDDSMPPGILFSMSSFIHDPDNTIPGCLIEDPPKTTRISPVEGQPEVPEYGS